jgi:uncharacterized lipoprotein YbaY
MNIIKGEIILPENAPETRAKKVFVEVRDVSMADALSTVVAEQRLENVNLKPGGRIKFKATVPEVAANRSLALRVHISLDGSGQVKSGDLLNTTYNEVPTTGASGTLEVPVAVI